MKKACADCHGLQKTLYEGGTLAGLKVPKDIMAEAGTDCAACHLDKDRQVIRPDAGACVACHDENYRPTFQEWRDTVAKLAADLRAAIHDVSKHPLDGAAKAQLKPIEEILRSIEADGSAGIHNYLFLEETLTAAAKTVKALAAAKKGCTPCAEGVSSMSCSGGACWPRSRRSSIRSFALPFRVIRRRPP
jgi:hypothetical protein